jgi:hypothetical protein
MTWFYNNQEFITIPEKTQGFVYCITNLENGRKYVGKKNFWTQKTKQVKGKKKKFKVESDWQSYYGSNDELKDDVEKLGPDKFKREILYLCENKGSMTYLETRELFDRRVLESDDYYNRWIMCRVNQSHLKNIS